MEDKVPFKAYTYWKDQAKPEVRRFGIEKSVVTSYCYLDAKLQDVYPGLKNKRYTVSWKDEEGDDVIISSDEEMIIALSAMNENLMKLYVYSNDEEPTEIDCDVVITTDVNAPADNNLPHCGVVCDVCDSPVVGFRYKCTSCPDYDLCSKCEAGGHHSEHIMVRVPTPNLPRTTIRAAIRRSRHIMKAVATSMTEPECVYKRSKGERTADKKRHHVHHGDGSRGDHQHHRGDHQHHRRPRPSWLETFANYMNEFANLAGDVDTESAKNKDNTPKNTQNVPQDQTTQSGNAQTSPKEPEATTSGASVNDIPNAQCPFSTDINQENIKKLVKMIYGADISNLLSQLTPSHVSTDENNQESSQQSEADKQSVKSDVSSTTKEVNGATKKDESPERATDDWTVINNEKDLMDTEPTPSAPYEQTTTIGFNLPQEFQERVKISDGQSLYPPLHTASAVMNPKESKRQTTSQEKDIKADAKIPVAEPVKQKISPPSTSQPKAKPQPQPQINYHPKPHIDAAIKQMLGMGFTNEGGWLTQLIESKDGNIAAVLDLLSPVIAKK